MDIESSGPTIALLGHTGNGNLGDEAITESVIFNIKQRLPNAQFILFSIVPEDSQRRHGYPAYPLRPLEDASISSIGYINWQTSASDSASSPLHERSGWRYTKVEWRPTLKQRLGRVFNWITQYPAIRRNEARFDLINAERLRQVDLMIFTGSNQFLDNFGGPWAFPYTLFRWAKLAQNTNTPLAFASIGAGPIYSPKSIRFIRQAICRAAYVSVRDIPSKDLLVKAGCREPIEIAPDLAFSLPQRLRPPARSPERSSIQSSEQPKSVPVIAINPMPIYASNYWYVADEYQYANFVSALAQLAIYLRNKQYPFFFFATQPKDENVMHDVFKRLHETGHKGFDQQDLTHVPGSVEDLQHLLGSADIIVATRFHGTVIGLHSKKLVLSTSYYRKAADLLEQFGLGHYAFQIEDLDVNELINKIEQIVNQHAMLAPTIEDMQARYQTELEQQYDKLISLI